MLSDKKGGIIVKIEIIKHNDLEDFHEIEVRVEQETGINNSYNKTVKIEKAIADSLDNDELYTLAYYRVKDNIIEKFKSISYEEEEDVSIDFKIIEPKVKAIRIEGESNIIKEIGKSYEAYYKAKVIDQYGNHMKNVSVKLDEDYDNIILKDGVLSIGSFNGQIVITSSYYSHTASLTVSINEYERKLTEQEIILNAIAEIYEMIGGSPQ